MNLKLSSRDVCAVLQHCNQILKDFCEMQITSMILYTKETLGNQGKVRVSQNPELLRGEKKTLRH